MPLFQTPALWLPSYAQGFARSAAKAANPGLWSGLGGYWDSELGVTGLSLFDVSGYGNHGVLTSMLPSAWSIIKGRRCLSILSGDYVQAADTPRVQIGSGDFSVSTWIYMQTSIDTAFQISTSDTVVPGWVLGAEIHQAGRLLCLIHDGVASKAIKTESAWASVNHWYHLVGTVNRRTDLLSLYVDGVLIGSTDISATGSVANTYGPRLAWGRSIGGNNHYGGPATGVWNRVLSLDESQLLYQDPHAIVRPMMRLPVGAAAAPGGNAPTGTLYGPLHGPLAGVI